MAQRRSAPLAPDPLIPSAPPASTVGRITGDQLISELLRYGRPRFPAQGSDCQSFMSHVAKLAKILTGASGSAIALRGEQGTICCARSGEGAPPLGAPVDTSSGISKQCLDSGKPLRCDDIATDGRVDPELCRAVGIRALAVVPIYSSGEISGILEVFSSVPGVFTEQHLQRLQQLASWLGSSTDTSDEEPILSSNSGLQLTPRADINLLVELQPAYRAFFQNLADVLSLRSSGHSTASPVDAQTWNDIFIDFHVPRKRFFQSVFLHIALMGMLSGISKIYPPEVLVFRPPIPEAHITYYPFSQSFPARESSPPAVHPGRPKAAQPVNTAGRERQHSAPPQQREADALTRPFPAMPMFAINRFRSPGLGTATPVAPLPDIDGAKASQSHLPNTPVIAPPPELTNHSGSRRLDVPNMAVVSPSPEVPGSLARAGLIHPGRPGIGAAGTLAVSIVQPPPSINDRPLLAYGPTGITPQAGEQVVAPPPSIQSLTKLGPGGSASSGGGISQVVPPPPSLEGGNRIGGGGGQARSLGGGGSQVVPPPPSMQNEGNYTEGRGIGTLAHADSPAVPPPPSVPSGAAGNSGAGRSASSLARPDAGTVLPPATNQTAFNSKAAAPKFTKDRELAPPLAEATASPMSSMIQEVPLRVLGLAWAPARSSYFSNFEVFVAERWLNKEQSQFIKLVYVFLPYEQRLSEYGFDSKVRKLRVTRDPTCDESLAQLAETQSENAPTGSHAPDALASVAHDDGKALPCYRTTADDYRRAIAHRK